MPLRSFLAFGLACAAMLTFAAPALGWHELTTRPSPHGAIAGCLRPAGDGGTIGLTGAPGRRSIPYDLLGLDSLDPRGTLGLGNLARCPELARTPGGRTVAAALTMPSLRAPFALRASVDGRLSTLATTRSGHVGETIAVASSPTGETLVAWVHEHIERMASPGRARLMVSRAAPGEGFGRPVALTGWSLLRDFSPTPAVAAAYDAAGRATIAWSSPRPPRGRTHELSRVETFAAEPGATFGAAQPTGPVTQDLRRLALAVSPAGRALLAFDGNGSIKLFERAAPGDRFAPVGLPGVRPGDADQPALAMRAEGGAVIGWRIGAGSATGEYGIRVAVRPSAGAPFSPSRTVVAAPRAEAFGGTFGVILLPGRPSTPRDEDNVTVTAAVDDAGAFTLAWGSAPATRFGDAPVGAYAVAGSLDGHLGPVRRLGCGCRAVNGIRALLGPAGPAVAFTDNATSLLGSSEIASGAGRLHLALPSLAGDAAPRPRLTVRAQPRTLGFDDPLPIRVGCDRACDVRAVVAARGRSAEPGPLALGMASLRRAGATRLEVQPEESRNLAPPGGGSVRVVVRAYAPDGRRFAKRAVRVRLQREPVAPLPRPADVTARRQGRAVVVTWTYPRHPDQLTFLVQGRVERPRHGTRPGLGYRTISSRPYRERRRVVLHPKRPEHLRYAAVSVHQLSPPRVRTVVVPVTG